MRIIVGGEGERATLFVAGVLARAGHVVDQAGDCAAAFDFAAAVAGDAVVLCPATVADALLGAIARLRARQPQAAIVVVATTADAAQRCALLDAGADDVIATPAGGKLLLARLSAAVRRAWGHASPEIRIGALAIRLGRWECRVDGQIIALTEMEYRLLEALALRRGQPVSRARLLELLYTAGREPFQKSIDLFMHNVRRKLAFAGRSGCLASSGQGFVLRDDERPAAG